MRFTRLVLEGYLATAAGKEALLFFEHLPALVKAGDPQKRITQFINKFLFSPVAQDFFDISPESDAKNDAYQDDTEKAEEEPITSIEECIRVISDEIESSVKELSLTMREFLTHIPIFSLYCFVDIPDFAFPYLFPVHFNLLEEIFSEFEIPLPPLPGKRKYKERALYYLEICKAVYEFRERYALSPFEMCTLVYSFAPKLLNKNQDGESSLASKAWIVGASTDDTKRYLSDLTSNTVRWWAGNDNMQKGDVVLMYEVAPYSHIRSVWTAASNGYDDPFHYYPGKVWLERPIQIPAISFQEMAKHPVLSKNSLVRAHMQGMAGGVSLSGDDYKAFLSLLAHKGGAVPELPALAANAFYSIEKLKNEHDVEITLLEPFLRRLGLDEGHWMRQMPLRMGRGIRYYPDYVLQPRGMRGEEQGAFIWEAKYRIHNRKELEEAFYQAKSYALRLGCRGLGIAALEGIWLSFACDNFSFGKMRHLTWEEISDVNVFRPVQIQLKKVFSAKGYGKEFR